MNLPEQTFNFTSHVRGVVTIWLGTHTDEESIDRYLSDTESANNLSKDFTIERERTYQGAYVFGPLRPIHQVLEGFFYSDRYTDEARKRAESLGVLECSSAFVVRNLWTDYIPNRLKLYPNRLVLLGSFQFQH